MAHPAVQDVDRQRWPHLLAKKMAEVRVAMPTRRSRTSSTSRGPELLEQIRRETERRIRLIFQRAREVGRHPGDRFDEMDSFRTCAPAFSDVIFTVVPQLLSEIDGVEGPRMSS